MIMRKKFEKLLLKNTMAIALPAIVVLLVLLFMVNRYSIFARVESTVIGPGEDYEATIENLYDMGHTNVEFKMKDLYYTGFEYYIDGKVEGAYYYTMGDGKMYIFLLDTKEPESYIEEMNIKGKILKEDISSMHIINRFAQSSDIDNELLQAYCFDYIVSEPDYPHALVLLIKFFFALPIVLAVLVILYTIVLWFNPALHGQCKQLALYGQIPAIIEELNLQLKNNLLFKKHKIYITKDYLIVNYFIRTDVVKLDSIKYMSKNLVEKKEFGNRANQVYRLTMSDPEVLFYEVDFVSEELIDDVIGYIRGINNKEKSS